MLLAIVLAWVAVVAVVLVAWSRLRANGRAAEGIDEELYVNGLDERSLAEAA